MPVNRTLHTRKLITLPRSLLARVKRYRFRNEIETETEAIRRLLTAALDAAGVEDEPERQQRREG